MRKASDQQVALQKRWSYHTNDAEEYDMHLYISGFTAASGLQAANIRTQVCWISSCLPLISRLLYCLTLTGQ